MHLLLTVIDRKADDLVITEGGTNAVGWERFEHDYFPVLSLSQPALRENACAIMGSLCTPMMSGDTLTGVRGSSLVIYSSSQIMALTHTASVSISSRRCRMWSIFLNMKIQNS
jgi:hypothetical protein